MRLCTTLYRAMYTRTYIHNGLLYFLVRARRNRPRNARLENGLLVARSLARSRQTISPLLRASIA
jgi:hypothetical protein